MKRILYTLLTLILLISCKQNYTINGSATLLGLEGKKLFLRTWQEDQWKDLDSTDIIHCEFRMQGKTDSIIMAALFLDNQNIMPIVLEKGNIKITINNKEITADGTLLNQTLYKFIEKKNNLEHQLEDLHKDKKTLIIESSSRRNNQLLDKAHHLELKLQRLTDSFIQCNYDNILGPNFFMMSYGNTAYPLLTPEIKKIINKAPKEFRNNYLVKKFISKATENMHRLENHNTTHSIEHNASLQ